MVPDGCAFGRCSMVALTSVQPVQAIDPIYSLITINCARESDAWANRCISNLEGQRGPRFAVS